jgi:hypothetical protein
VRSDGQDETLDTACRDHNLVVFLEGVGVAGPETVLDDPQWVESGAAATPTQTRPSSAPHTPVDDNRRPLPG